MAVRVAVNGFGRTGRAFLRAAMKAQRDVEVVAVNDLAPPEALARLLARDSVHGAFPEPVSVEHDTMFVGSMGVKVVAEGRPEELPWRDLGIDVVIESTGRLTNRDQAAAHLEAGAQRVIVSAPAKGVDATFVVGVNDDTFDPARHVVVSNASCTTNCLAVLAKVLNDAFGIEDGFMTTVHAYTGDQQLVDGLHKDPRRARGAAINIVPTTTGAARATGLVLPDLHGRLDGMSLRVPVPDGSITDLVANLRAGPTTEEICAAYREAAGAGRLAGLLEFSDEDLVSSDIVGSTASCVFDSKLTMAHGHLVKVFGWYDNEIGYASRLVDLAALVGAATGPSKSR
jgi:glyceraldehyde 3-phosphate dehydrogenase (phosphorylating)